MTDADTVANAELLWQLVHAVQDTIGPQGDVCLRGEIPAGLALDALDRLRALADLRRLADALDPDYGRY